MFNKNLNEIQVNIMKSSRQFKVIVEIDEDGVFIGRVPALPGCYTQAKTLKELKKRIYESILLCIEIADSDPDYRERITDYSYEPNFVGLELVTV
jgi:predicted RNase H-like HicB family nuclease